MYPFYTVYEKDKLTEDGERVTQWSPKWAKNAEIKEPDIFLYNRENRTPPPPGLDYYASAFSD